MMNSNNVFEDYVLWNEEGKLNKSFDNKRSERKYLLSYNKKEKLKGNYQAVMVEGLLYLEKTRRDRYADWSYILRLMPYIKYPENCILINGESPTQIQLAELLNIKERRLRDVLKELEYVEVIKIKKNGRNNIIYINPFFVRSGIEIYTETCEMFRETTFCSLMKN